MEQVAILEYRQQEELKYLIYGAAFLLADVGLFQEPAYTDFLDCISEFALNFGVVFSSVWFIMRLAPFLGIFLV